jgi:hypothetical protein
MNIAAEQLLRDQKREVSSLLVRLAGHENYVHANVDRVRAALTSAYSRGYEAGLIAARTQD